MIALDKQAHFLSGYAIAATLAPLSLLFATSVALLAGALKEKYDARHRATHTPDVRDALATAAGGLAGTLAYYAGTWLC